MIETSKECAPLPTKSTWLSSGENNTPLVMCIHTLSILSCFTQTIFILKQLLIIVIFCYVNILPIGIMLRKLSDNVLDRVSE